MKSILNDYKIISKNGKLIAYPYDKLTGSDTLIPYKSNHSNIHNNIYLWAGQWKSMDILTKKGYYKINLSYGDEIKSYSLNSDFINFNDYGLSVNLNYNSDFIYSIIDLYYGENPKEFNVELINKNTDYNAKGLVNFYIYPLKPKSVMDYLSNKAPSDSLAKSYKKIETINFVGGSIYDNSNTLFDTDVDKIAIYCKEYKEETYQECTSYKILDFDGIPDELFDNTTKVTFVIETYYLNKDNEYTKIISNETPITLYNF